jgi:Raf kinase inhibitor-like YbhB/YbcL family protein
MALELTSDAFEAGGMIPEKYTCDGEGISPPLSWTGVPAEAKGLALICEDPDAPSGTYSHWVLYNIPVQKDGLPERFPAGGQPEWGGVQGANQAGDLQYRPPCPPAGPAHRYVLRLYALDGGLDLAPGASRQEVMDRVQGHVLADVELTGYYARNQ